MWELEAWENKLFDDYNGEGRQSEEEFWANAWDDLRIDNVSRETLGEE